MNLQSPSLSSRSRSDSESTAADDRVLEGEETLASHQPPTSYFSLSSKTLTLLTSHSLCFANDDSRKRRKLPDDDEDAEIESDSDEDGFSAGEVEDESEEETVPEARKRMAQDVLRKFREIEKKKKEQRDEKGGGSDEEEEDEGARDSLIAQKLIKEQQEESGRIRRAIASSVKLGGDGGFGVLVKHRHSVTAVALSEDDSKGFSASKDGSIVQWDVVMVYLDMKEYAAALANCRDPFQRDQVYLLQAEAAFSSKDYFRAASFYAKKKIVKEFRAFLSDSKDVLDETTTMKLLERCSHSSQGHTSSGREANMKMRLDFNRKLELQKKQIGSSPNEGESLWWRGTQCEPKHWSQPFELRKVKMLLCCYF